MILTLGSAITSSAGYVLQKSIQKSYNMPALGASGMVMGMGAAALLLFPYQTVVLKGTIPMPLWACVAGFAVVDGYFLNRESKIAHSGHLGRLAWGAAYYFFLLYRFCGFKYILQIRFRR